MKRFLLTGLLLILFACGDEEKKNCIDESKITNNLCSKQYEPVCGCDGKTYGNDCFARNAGVSEWIKGECN